jgi:hypothetical protein
MRPWPPNLGKTAKQFEKPALALRRFDPVSRIERGMRLAMM